MTQENNDIQKQNAISEADREGLYKVIYGRRDVRGQFKPDPIPRDKLYRVLKAAHHAPSVGFMQPWNFMIIEKPEVKQRVHTLFTQANAEAAELFDGEEGQLYKTLKLEGILESPMNICITCDREREGEHVLGRTHQKQMDLYSTVCAVQNFWLAARAEGLGAGWVSIYHEAEMKEVLGIPDHIEIVAYMCIGYVRHFYSKPELEKLGWKKRTPLDDLVFFDEWGNHPEPSLSESVE